MRSYVKAGVMCCLCLARTNKRREGHSREGSPLALRHARVVVQDQEPVGVRPAERGQPEQPTRVFEGTPIPDVEIVE